MLSHRFYKLVGVISPLVYKLGFFRLTWDPKKRLMVLPPRCKRLLLINSFVGQPVWFIFLWVQLYRFHCVRDINRFAFTFTLITAYIISLLAIIYCNWFAEDVCFLYNVGLTYLRRVHRTYQPHKDPNKDRLTKLLDLGVVVQIVGIISLDCLECLSFIIRPDFYVLFGSLLPDHCIFLQGLTVLYHIYTLTMMYVCLLILQVFGCYLFGVYALPFLAQELRLGRQPFKYKTIDTLREPRTLQLEYRTGQIIVKLFNAVTGRFIIPLQASFTIMSIFSAFMAIKFRNEIDPPYFFLMVGWSVAFPFFWTFGLTVAGYIHSKSGRVIASMKYNLKWRSASERVEMSKFRQSCGRLVIGYGKTYVIRRASIMAFVRGLVRGLKRALLTLK